MLKKAKCGIDMIDAMEDGRVTWRLYDYGAYYTPQYFYRRQNGRHTAGMIQFYRKISEISMSLK